MYLLERVHLVQFFLFQAQTLELDATSAIIAPNGAGKSALLDALQIVLMGGDRSRIRFNAQAGGSPRARTIRDYCLGAYRSGEDGRCRRTATTYISLVFAHAGTGQTLTAGIALGASADEPDHRTYGLYVLPGVSLELEDHLDRRDGRELPLAWSAFRELIARRCRRAGTSPQLHSTADRFVKDLLLQLRPAPNVFLDAGAYRKALQNALNLQKHDDIDLFVRNFVAEERPTDIARFRALLESFRQIRQTIEQVAQRIEAAEHSERKYAELARQAVRGASWNALALEYERDLHSERLEAAEQALERAREAQAEASRGLAGKRQRRDAAKEELEQVRTLQRGSAGYGQQAQLDALAGRDREDMVRLKRELLRQAAFVRDQLQAASELRLPALSPAQFAEAAAPWQALHAHVSGLPADAGLALDPETARVQMQQALERAEPIVHAVAAHARTQQAQLDALRQQARDARENLKRLDAGESELRPDVLRLLQLLHQAGIQAQPVCDLVRVADPSWQPAIEGYLRSHVDALLVPEADEKRAVRLYRGSPFYGVKLALTSHARRQSRAAPEAASVAALLQSDNADALAYLRRQLGDLRCVDTEDEVVRARQGLTRDGLVAKGGGIERLRLPSAGELRIGVRDNRERLRQLREEAERVERQLRELEPLAKSADACASAFARIGGSMEAAEQMHSWMLEHGHAERRYRARQDSRAAIDDPDLLRLAEQVQALEQELRELDGAIEILIRQQAVAEHDVAEVEARLLALRADEQAIARRVAEAFRDPDVDNNRVERRREELEARTEDLHARVQQCQEQARRAMEQLQKLIPDAWSGLQQYAREHGLTLDMEPTQWRDAQTLLRGELERLRETELVRHQAAAEEAYATAVLAFRQNVVSALHDNFERLRQQIGTLNRTLRRSPAFSNNERYQFRYEVLPALKELHGFIRRAAEVGADDTLFGSAGEVPQAFREIIEDAASGRATAGPSPLDDYRRFFSFEVDILQGERRIGTLSERMRSGSGGEHRAPLYVIAGAALAAAYGKSEHQQGGLGVILLDEFGDKIDAQNARATADYLRSLGLQLILAAPDTAQGTLSGVLDSYIELFRDGELIQVERVEVTEAGRALLQSDQFTVHPRLLAEETARIERERAAPVSDVTSPA